MISDNLPKNLSKFIKDMSNGEIHHLIKLLNCELKERVVRKDENVIEEEV